MTAEHQPGKIISVFLLIAALVAALLICSCSQTPLHPSYRYGMNDTVPAGNGQTVKVVILSGQSNALGCSMFSYLESEPDYDHLAAGFSTDNEPVGNPDRAHYDVHWELVLGRWFGESIAAAL